MSDIQTCPVCNGNPVLVAEAWGQPAEYCRYCGGEGLDPLALVDQLRAHITDLEAQLAALRNPPYRVEVETLRDGCDGVYTYSYRAYVLSGHDEAFVSDVEDSYGAARSAAVKFIEGLKE